MGQGSNELEHVAHHDIEIVHAPQDESIRHAVDKMLGAEESDSGTEADIIPDKPAIGSADVELPVVHAASTASMHSVKIEPIVVKPAPQEADLSSESVVSTPSLVTQAPVEHHAATVKTSASPVLPPQASQEVVTPADLAAAELAASPSHDDAKHDAVSSNPDEIRAEIERTRDDMSRTIDAIQDKLDPQRIKEQVKESVHDATIGRVERLTHDAREKIGPTAKAKGAQAAEFIKKYPLPLAAAALSLVWLLFKRGQDDDFTIEL